MRKIINTEKAPAAIGPYSQGICTGDLVFTSGQLPIDPATGEMPADVEAQAEQSLKNVQAILEAAGSDMSKAVKLTVFLADIKDFAKVNEVYARFFADEPPCRSAFQVAHLPKDALIEIEAIAVK